MGVLACDRNRCENIMCDYYSPIYGYICNECFEELMEGKERSIEAFMESIKDGDKFDDTQGWVDFVNNIFCRD